MPVAVSCTCGHKFEVRDEYQGRTVKCPSCSQPVRAGQAAPGKQSSKSGSTSMNKVVLKSDMIAFSCGCGKRIAARREWAGKRTKCPSCGESVRIPGEPKRQRPSEPASAMDELLDEVGVAKAAQRCPECKAEMQAGHVICIQCGYDLERGKKLTTKRFHSSKRQLDMNAPAKQKTANPLMKFVAAGVLLILVIVAAVLVPRLLG